MRDDLNEFERRPKRGNGEPPSKPRALSRFHGSEAVVVRLFVRHRVDDYRAWRQVYDAFDSQRGPLGVMGRAEFQSVDDPNDVTVWHDFADLERARAFASSDNLRDAMQKAGVRGQPEIWFVNPA
jgi:hypothetical protein